LNTGAALLIAGRASSVREGIALSANGIDTGAARGVLERLVKVSHQEAAA
jgi:anthranilate phosphoribosyltransferase